MPARTVTGSLVDLNADPAAGVRLSFKRSGVVAQDGDVVLPDPVETTTASGGTFSIDLLPGNYSAFARTSRGPLRFTFSLASTGSTDLAELLDEAVIVATPDAVTQARAARDEAIAAVAAVPLTRDAYSTVAALLADTILNNSNTVLGQIIWAGGFRYERAASTATDHHVTTAGGVKLYVLPFRGGYDFAAFGGKPESGFDNGPALRVARAALEALSETSDNPHSTIELRFERGTFEVSTGETGNTAGVLFTKSPRITGAGWFETKFEWYAPTENQPLFLVKPSVATPRSAWRPVFKEFSVWARVGTNAGSAIRIECATPSASLAPQVTGVRVVGCKDGIAFVGSGTNTVYGGLIELCSVEGVIDGGKGYRGESAVYCAIRDCEGYPDFDGDGDEAYTLHWTGGCVRTSNYRCAGPVYIDSAEGVVDVVVEGQGSTCLHNGSAAILVNRAASIRASVLGGRITAETTPRYGVILQDSGYVIERLEVSDISGFSSPITALSTSGNAVLLSAKINGTGVLMAEDDIETGLDPTFGGKLRIIDGGNWTDYGEWSFTYNPGNIVSGNSITTTVTCDGLRSLTTPVSAAFDQAVSGIVLHATVISATQVEVRIFNYSGSDVDMGSGTLTIRAHQPR